MPVQNLDDLSIRLARFARIRDWKQFHSPKNLSMALAPCVRIHVASPSWGKLESKQGAGKRNQWPVIQKNVRHPC